MRTYAQDFYSSFYSGYATDYTDFGNYFSGDDFTDDFLTLAGGYYYFPKANNTEYNSVTGTWSTGYDIVYKANVMIEKIPDMNISEEAKNHWTGIARYFRAMAGAKDLVYTADGSPTGYPTKKFLNDEWFAQDLAYCKNRQSPADAPCIRYAEVLLNYAEAMYESGQFSPSVLDATINQLRKRQLTKWGDTEAKTMPAMTYASGALSVNGTVINDPARDPEVDPVLWEIRRERRVELMMEGRRGEDLRRWAKYEYLNSEDANGNPSKTILGAYMNVNDYPASAALPAGERGYTLFNYADPTNATPDKGYIKYNYVKGMRVFKKGDINSERYYLRAVPVSQITAYSDKGFTLTQNPGW